MNRLAFCLLFIFPVLGWTQLTQKDITQDLPKTLRYKLLTKDFNKQTIKATRNSSGVEQAGDSIRLGCSDFAENPLPLAFVFTVREKGLKKRKHKLVLYAVKRENYRLDEKIINALDLYCYYGQMNYYFMTNKYLLFTYTIGGDEFALVDPDRITKFENLVVTNINSLD